MGAHGREAYTAQDTPPPRTVSWSYSSLRRAALSSLESLMPGMQALCSMMHAQATTGPARGPLPASSTPAGEAQVLVACHVPVSQLRGADGFAPATRRKPRAHSPDSSSLVGTLFSTAGCAGSARAGSTFAEWQGSSRRGPPDSCCRRHERLMYPAGRVVRGRRCAAS